MTLSFLDEDIVGPVLTFEVEEEALALANHPTYGLAGWGFTRDISRAIRVTRRLQAGTSWVNRTRDMTNRKSKSILIDL